jgi:mannose-binding lectin 2
VDLFLGAGMTIPYWDFMGSTMVTNNYVRLTPDSQSKQGLLWNSVVSNNICIILSTTGMKFPS